MSDESFRFTPEAPAAAADENALLRASLAEAQRRIDELERAAETDPQTGLPNERRFRREIERVVGQAERHGTLAAVVGIEIEGLEAVEQGHGRFAADAALVHAARLLTDLIRSTDVLARTGDNSFGLILDHLDHNSAIDTAERLARCIGDTPLDLGSDRIRIGAVVATTGILPGDSVEDVLQRADANLARMKSGF